MTTQGTAEPEDLVSCRGCGDTVSLSLDRVFALDEEDGLCLGCATRRGGRYDEQQDRWTVEPQVDDLAADVVRER